MESLRKDWIQGIADYEQKIRKIKRVSLYSAFEARSSSFAKSFYQGTAEKNDLTAEKLALKRMATDYFIKRNLVSD